jgi:hypothetical protein
MRLPQGHPSLVHPIGPPRTALGFVVRDLSRSSVLSQPDRGTDQEPQGLPSRAPPISAVSLHSGSPSSDDLAGWLSASTVLPQASSRCVSRSDTRYRTRHNEVRAEKWIEEPTGTTLGPLRGCHAHVNDGMRSSITAKSVSLYCRQASWLSEREVPRIV